MTPARLTQCHIHEPWDGESCPPCRGRGALVVGEYGICPPAVVACPWCGGDGFSGRKRAEVAALQRMWKGDEMVEQDRAARAREMIREEIDGLERIYKERHGDFPARPEDRDYRKGRIDGLKQAGELLGEGE